MRTAPSKEERALTGVAIFAGAAAIITYPAALTAGPALGLAFVIPVSLAAVGRLRQQRSVELGGIGTVVVLVGGIVLGLTQLVVLLLIIAPVAVLLLVAGHLLSIDVSAGRAWRLGASLGLLFGHGTTFLFAQPRLGVALAIPCLSIGAAVAQTRLHRGRSDQGSRRGGSHTRGRRSP